MMACFAGHGSPSQILDLTRLHRVHSMLSAFLVGLTAALSAMTAPAAAEPVHGIAMHGTPALKSGFQQFPYVNPDAPKGGRLRLGAQGSFASLNPFIIKGVAPPGLRDYVYESVMA